MTTVKTSKYEPPTISKTFTEKVAAFLDNDNMSVLTRRTFYSVLGLFDIGNGIWLIFWNALWLGLLSLAIGIAFVTVAIFDPYDRLKLVVILPILHLAAAALFTFQKAWEDDQKRSKGREATSAASA